jgi:aspartyl protease family protein
MASKTLGAISLLFVGTLIGVTVVFLALDSGTDEKQTAEIPTSAPQVSAATGWTTEINVAPDGHYYVDTMVNHKRIRFMVDTGASSVVLSTDDARRLNIRLSDQDYEGRVNTANGASRAALVRLRTMRIDDNWFYDVPAVVVEGNATMSLLGLSFLRELEHFEFDDKVLVLHW